MTKEANKWNEIFEDRQAKRKDNCQVELEKIFYELAWTLFGEKWLEQLEELHIEKEGVIYSAEDQQTTE